MIKVVNKKIYKGKGHYIGRGTPLGNPYRLKSEARREEIIYLYRVWLWNKFKDNDSKVMGKLRELMGEYLRTGELTLICHCAPKACHGDVIKNILEWLKTQGPNNG